MADAATSEGKNDGLSCVKSSMEGALKMNEISYIHAEAYAAGELKHGPLALVSDEIPAVAVAPNDRLLEKLTQVEYARGKRTQ